jgi:hypothetical protein
VIVDKARVAHAVGAERYELGRRIAWASAPRCGSMVFCTETEKDDDSNLYNIVDEVLEAAFTGLPTTGDKMRAMCALYEDFPSYTIVSQLFMTVGFDGLSSAELASLLAFLGTMLSAAEIELAQPAAYVLWVDFFEDDNRVDAAWETVCDTISSDEGWRRLLAASGPVREKLKFPVIERFLPDQRFHDAIFDALSAGVFDIYGRIERTTVESMLPKLRIDRTHAAYQQLLVRLADPAPIEFGWRLKADAGHS